MNDPVADAIGSLMDKEDQPGIVVSGLILCLRVTEEGEGIHLLPMSNTRPHEALGLLNWAEDQYLRALNRRSQEGGEGA